MTSGSSTLAQMAASAAIHCQSTAAAITAREKAPAPDGISNDSRRAKTRPRSGTANDAGPVAGTPSWDDVRSCGAHVAARHTRTSRNSTATDGYPPYALEREIALRLRSEML